MRCIVTAGPTYEPLDQVRRLTNFSTGRLGSELAGFLSRHGHEVTLLLGEQAPWRGDTGAAQVRSFSTTANLGQQLRALAADPFDAVFHAAAVSDFAFGKVWLRSAQGDLTEITSGKISTREGSLLAELVPTAKILAQLRDWFPQALIVGWKYEVEGDRAAMLELARRQLRECRNDLCVANGRAYGDGFGLVSQSGPERHCPSVPELYAQLGAALSGSRDGGSGR